MLSINGKAVMALLGVSAQIKLASGIQMESMNTCVKCLFEYLFLILWGIYAGVELLDHMVPLWLTFEEPPNYFPKRLLHFSFPLAISEGSSFSTSSSTLTVLI